MQMEKYVVVPLENVPSLYKEKVCNKFFDKCKVNCAKLSNSPVFDESTDNIPHIEQHACKHFIWMHMCVMGGTIEVADSAAPPAWQQMASIEQEMVGGRACW